MLQVSGSCAHILDPSSVYIETKPIREVFACMGLVLMNLQLILTTYANEWV